MRGWIYYYIYYYYIEFFREMWILWNVLLFIEHFSCTWWVGSSYGTGRIHAYGPYPATVPDARSSYHTSSNEFLRHAIKSTDPVGSSPVSHLVRLFSTILSAIFIAKWLSVHFLWNLLWWQIFKLVLVHGEVSQMEFYQDHLKLSIRHSTIIWYTIQTTTDPCQFTEVST